MDEPSGPTLSPLLTQHDLQVISAARNEAQVHFNGEDAPQSPLRTVEIPARREEFVRMIDHCLLSTTATDEDVRRGAQVALDYGFRSFCVHPAKVRVAHGVLAGSRTKVVAMVSFPSGQATRRVKVFEARDAIDSGANAVDVVANLGALMDRNFNAFFDEIHEIVEAVRGHEVIVILEAGLLGEVHLLAVGAYLAELAGAAVVKTSTGFAYRSTHWNGRPSALGAEPRDVAVMAASVSPQMVVKAAGSIRTYEDAVRMLRAGATRIGTSNGPLIVDHLSPLDRTASAVG